MKKCPYCSEDIQDGAIVCAHCGKNLNTVEQIGEKKRDLDPYKIRPIKKGDGNMAEPSNNTPATSEPAKIHIVKTDSISEETYNLYINAAPAKEDRLSFQDWALRDQVKKLGSINSKLAFFVFLIVLGLIVSFFQIIF